MFYRRDVILIINFLIQHPEYSSFTADRFFDPFYGRAFDMILCPDTVSNADVCIYFACAGARRQR